MTMIIKYANISSVQKVICIQEIFLKKNFQFYIILFSFLSLFPSLNSCKNAQESSVVVTENNTIKKTVKDKELEITWTQELENERLTKSISRDTVQLGPDVSFNKDLYKITNNKSPVYPYLTDFGSLDTSNMYNSVKEKINQFCQVFSEYEHSGAEEYFSQKYIFNYVFFVKDFEDGWNKYFNTEITEESKYFNKWIFGEPFNGSDIIQIPVRFYADCGTIDVTVFLNSSGNNEVYQITIDRWQKV